MASAGFHGAIDNTTQGVNTTRRRFTQTGTGADTIGFPVSKTGKRGCTLLPQIANGSPGFLTGYGQAIVVDGANLYGVLTVAAGATLNLDGLTIAHGNFGTAAAYSRPMAASWGIVLGRIFSNNTAGKLSQQG